MKVTFLGTGASHGIPVIGCNCNVCLSTDSKNQRLRSSVYIETSNNNLVIDVGPDFRQQMLREKITKVDAVLLTHEHKDHTAGLDDVRAFNYLMKKPMSIYAEIRVLSSIQKEYSYVFAENKYPGTPELDLSEIINDPFTISKDEITPIRAYHNLLPIYGFKIGQLAYLTDLKTIPEEEKKKLLNLDTLIISALRVKPHSSHLGLNEAIELVNELKPAKAYFTHISHMQYNHESLSKMLPKNIEVAYDGLKIEL